MVIKVLLYGLISGAVGMGVGALIGVFFNKKTENSVVYILSFSAGVMLAIVFFSLIPESLELNNNIYLLVLAIICGMGLVFLLDKIVDHNHGHNHNHEHSDETLENSPIETHGNKNMFVAGIVMLLALSLHNLPEGITIGAVGTNDDHSGILLAILVGIHNIPAGMSVATPLVMGGMKKTNAILLTILAGAMTVVGAGIGILLGSLNDSVTAFCIALSAGAMLYVILNEVLPQVMQSKKQKVATLILFVGIILGLVLSSII